MNEAVNDAVPAEMVDMFQSITQASASEAEFHLKAAGGNVEIAVNHFFSGATERVALHRAAVDAQAQRAAAAAPPSPAKQAAKAPARAPSNKKAIPAAPAAAAGQAKAPDGPKAPPQAPAAEPAAPAVAPVAAPKAPAAAPSVPANVKVIAKRPVTRSQTKAAKAAVRTRARAAAAGDTSSDSDSVPGDSSSTESSTSDSESDHGIPRLRQSTENAEHRKKRQQCEAKLHTVLQAVRMEIGKKMTRTKNAVLPPTVIDFLVSTLARPTWGSVDDLREVYGDERTADFGLPILKAYRRVRAQFLADTWELTGDEAAAAGNVDRWRAIELASVTELPAAASLADFNAALFEAAADQAPADAPAAAEPAARRAPRAEAPAEAPAKRKSRGPLQQRTLDGGVAAPAAAPAAKGKAPAPAPAADAGAWAADRARGRDAPVKMKGNLIRPSGLPRDFDSTQEKIRRVEAMDIDTQFRYQVNHVQRSQQEHGGAVIFDDVVTLRCLSKPALDYLKLVQKAPITNFKQIAAALAWSCPHCYDIRVDRDCRQHAVYMGLQHKVLDVNVLGDGDTQMKEATMDVNRELEADLRDGKDPFCADPFHRLICMLASEYVRSHSSVTDLVVHDDRAVFGLKIIMHIRRPVAPDTEIRPSELVRDTFDCLLDCFDPHNPIRATGKYPYVNADMVNGWRTVAQEECASPADMLRLAERSTLEAVVPDACRVPEDIGGISLRLKHHQRHSVGLMLLRETVGHVDHINVTTPTGATLHLNFLAGSLTYSGPKSQWNADIAPPNAVVRGGILADEMGLGKTLAVIALARLNQRPVDAPEEVEVPQHQVVKLQRLQQSQKYEQMFQHRELALDRVTAIRATLVVVPVSITGQWQTELQRCAPDARVLVFHGAQRTGFTLEDFKAADFILTTYETLRSTMEAEKLTVGAELLTDQAKNDLMSCRATFITRLHKRRKELREQNGKLFHVDADSKVESMATYTSLIPSPGVQLSRINFHRIVYDECQKAQLDVSARLFASHVWATSGTPIGNTIAPLRDLCGIIGWNITGRNAAFENNRFTSAVDAGGDRMVNVQNSHRNDDRDSYWRFKYGDNTPQGRRAPNIQLPAPCAALPSFNSCKVPQTAMWAWAITATQYIVRHAKNSAIAAEIALPPRTEVRHNVQMFDEERQLYNSIEQRVRADVEGLIRRERLGARIGFVLQWIDSLRRAAAHPRLAREYRDPDEMGADGGGGIGGGGGAVRENERLGIRIVTATEMLSKLRAKHNVAESTLATIQGLAKIPPELSDCAVCMCPLQEPCMLSCGHCYCRECVLQLVATATRDRDRAKCPECRAAINQNSIYQLEIASTATEQTHEERMELAKVLEAVGLGSKVKKLVDVIKDALNDDATSKFVVFSSYPVFMGMAGDAMKANNVPFCVIDGSTTLNKRSRLINEFQNGGTQVCIISSRCGNAGLTLTAGNHLILMEPNINVAVDAQAIARIHRFGQHRPVTIHRLVCENTVEDRIQILLESGRLDVDDDQNQRVASTKSASSKLGTQQMQFILFGNEVPNNQANQAEA